MKAITIQISDRDYEDLVAHFAADRVGRPLVAVCGLAGPSGSFLEADIEAAKKAHTSMEDAVCDANRWKGRCSIILRNGLHEVVSGNVPSALYVTVGMRFQDWEREAKA